jgi:hypothetical protein
MIIPPAISVARESNVGAHDAILLAAGLGLLFWTGRAMVYRESKGKR